MTHYHRVDVRRTPMMLFALSLTATLVACGGNGPLDGALLEAEADATAVPLGAANPETTLGTPPTEIRPSISAAQLYNDATKTVNFAQSLVPALPDAQEPTTQEPSTQAPSNLVTTPDPVVSAPTPSTEPVTDTNPVNPVPIGVNAPDAENPTGDVSTPTNPVAPVSSGDTTTDSQTDTTDSEPDQGAALPEPDTNTPDTSDNPDNSTQEPTNAEPLIVATFVGSNTPTFMGELTDQQTVILTWDEDPTARGYNVYRDAGYIATVFEPTYVDDFDAYDQKYYYEIQAFDFDENYTTIATGLTVDMVGTGRTDPNAPQVDTDLLNNYELVFSDEFNGNSLDLSKWNTAYLWGDELIINNELQHYVDIENDPDFGFNPFTFDGEALTINSIRTPENLLARANGQEYLSGVITSYDAFKFTYGYVEARAKVPVGKGYWPAFWLLNAYYDLDKPEIDIMEFIGDNQDTVYHTYHYYDTEGNLRSTKSEPTYPIDYSANFHTFGVEWQPGSATFYVDGIARHTIEDPKMSQEQMYIIANTAIGGWWPGDPDETTQFPGQYSIDYIRAYQRVGVQEDPPQFASPESNVPVRGPGSTSSPSHLPPFDLWPEGYPER